MTRTKLLGAISASALIILAAAPAHAGGGMGGSGDVTACRAIVGGVNPSQVVGLDLQSLPAEQVAQLGPPLLLCESAVARTVNTNKAPETAIVVGANRTVCYPVHAPSNVKNASTIEDPFTASNPVNPVQAVTLAGISLLCVQAVVTP